MKISLKINIFIKPVNKMVLPCLVYVHIGTNIPDYIYDSIYQTLLMNNYSCKIYVLIEDSEVTCFKETISNFNLNNYFNNDFYFENLIEIIPLSILNDELFEFDEFKKYKENLTSKFNNISEFRDGFWVSTTARFFYIYTFMKIFNISNVFHIENDVMIYKKITFLYEYIKEYLNNDNHDLTDINKICMIQDAPNRVIPSLMYFPNISCLYDLILHITYTLDKSSFFINDMNLLGTYPDKYLLSIDPTKVKNFENIIFDGAAIGQFLGGIDPKNFTNEQKQNKNPDLLLINNPTKGFVNESSTFKANICEYFKNKVHVENLKIKPKVYSCKKIVTNTRNKLYHIANLHIHCKQLYQFSSIFNISYNDIITGDKIVELCDFVILTEDIYKFHKNIDKIAKDIILIKDFTSVKFNKLNQYLNEKLDKKTDKVINLFVYTHILDSFIKYIFPNLDKTIKYNFYIHNSDNEFNDNHLNLLKHESVNHIFAQNINTSKTNEKLSLLPLGIANNMWLHGDLTKVFNAIKNTYKNKKTKYIYVNINPYTFKYRETILNNINKNSNFEISQNMSFENYLKELASHKFCLCIRGNGIDTHRFWESLYLGVIPVIINNKHTNCKTFVEYLKKQKIPFYEIKSENPFYENTKYQKEFFNDDLYKSIQKNNNFYDFDLLKISSY
jgi:hypothetical protein